VRPVPLIRASVLRPLFEHLDRAGASPSAALRSAPRILRDPRALLPLTVVGRLWEEAARVEVDSGIGLAVAERSERLISSSPLLWLVRREQTVGAALEVGARFGSRFNTGQRFWLTARGDEVAMSCDYTTALRNGRRQVSDYVLMQMINLIRAAAGRSWRPSEVHCEGDPPAHAEQIAALASRSTHFGAPCMAIVFPRRVLALRLPPSGDRGAAGEELLPDAEFEGSVRQTVDALLRLGSLNLAATAEAAGVSVRSFQRRLAETGASFGEIVDAARFDTARKLLADPTVKVIDVSTQLGYSDSANFTRAFRRWTGLPPQEFRRLAALSGVLAAT
jgi:AraC-like DNA-binding protein